MNASKLSTVERLAEELVARLTIELEASGRHVHLSRADVETLFGAGYRLNRTKDLSQPGQFACAERVTLEGPRGSLKNVVILGPERPESQVEISLTDAVALGLTPPVRLSGDTEGTPGPVSYTHLAWGVKELEELRGNRPAAGYAPCAVDESLLNELVNRIIGRLSV